MCAGCGHVAPQMRAIPGLTEYALGCAPPIRCSEAVLTVYMLCAVLRHMMLEVMQELELPVAGRCRSLLSLWLLLCMQALLLLTRAC